MVVPFSLAIAPVSPDDLFQGGVIKTVDSPRKVEKERGRDRGLSSSTSRLPSSRSRRTRSLSPLGASTQRREQMVTPSSPTPSGNGSKNGVLWICSCLEVLQMDEQWTETL
ncbi:hypothetical protein Tco_1523269 [Tanacetum coccineum]